ncbi:MAG TPA: S-adenosyl-l-methionine hydroxide adenosyltransferase, partial [Candidatus Desulfofervidus auxilii]|nr:S-adenosyl-l-methionine hydroxide adenosyltransferase [Candidatus Desulfofervidus auxilii]
MSIITLITDFGLEDTYVGIMKGVILNINPHVQIVDLTHKIRPQSIKQASFLLKT